MINKILLFLFLLCSPAFATDNPSLIGYPPNKIMGFLGLDTDSSASNIEDGRATNLLNVKLSGSVNLKKRPGYSVINTNSLDDASFATPAISGLFHAEYTSDISRTYAFVGDKLKYNTGTAWADVTNTATITSGQNYQWACAMALDNAICTDDYDIPTRTYSTPQIDKITFTGLSTPIAKAKAVIWYNNYLIWGNTVEGSTDRPTRFRWSNIGFINTYSDEDYNDIASLNGDEIVAFKEMYGELYIIMRKSIWKASFVGGDDVFVFVKLIDGIGAIARDSVQILTFEDNKQAIMFLSEDKKVFLFNGVTVSDAGSRIQPTLDNLNETRLQYAVSVFDGDNYYLSVSTSAYTYNDAVFVFNVFLGEWYLYDQIDANAFARVKESTSKVKTYFGNYDSFVYWLDNPALVNDVDGATGTTDSYTCSTSTTYETPACIIIDTGLTVGAYTGAIVRITGGTAVGEEAVILASTSTGLIVSATQGFTGTPDSTSVYSVGDINAYYYTKWYDFGDAPRQKSFRGMYFWAEEESGGEVVASYAEDFSSILDTETVSLASISTSLWDFGVWDSAIWGSDGNKFYTAKHAGRGRMLQVKFSQAGVDKDFNIYGFHLLADRLDVE
jgi:hypothetical protein